MSHPNDNIKTHLLNSFVLGFLMTVHKSCKNKSWSPTRGLKCSDLTWKLVVFWKLVAEWRWSLKTGCPKFDCSFLIRENAYDRCNEIQPYICFPYPWWVCKVRIRPMVHKAGAYPSFCNTTSALPMKPLQRLPMLKMVQLWRSGAIVEKCNSVPAYRCLSGCLWTPRIIQVGTYQLLF